MILTFRRRPSNRIGTHPVEDWGAPLTAENTPKWGNKEEATDPEWANERRNKGRAQDRRSRDSEIARGGSPPPKLEEENLFSEGNSRKTSKPVYRKQNDITDKVWDSNEKFSNGGFKDKMKRKRSEAMENGASFTSRRRRR
jgi:hypothetical protein